MEGVTSFYKHLHNLRSQAETLIDARLELNTLFAEEETRLQREDEASILMAVRRAVVKELQELKRIESSASLDHSQASAISYVAGLTAQAIFSKDNRASALKDYIMRKATERKQSFGLVMVCIGPKGLPDDAEVVSISRLARDSNRSESEIVKALRENGYLVFAEETFSYLIDRLTTDIRLGKLRLPVSGDKLAQILGFNGPGSSIRIVPIP
jgi:hypothetical protein